MAFDWNAYLDFAEQLTTEGATKEAEANNRSAVSRAYYAVYNIARDHALSCVTDRGSSRHRRLIKYFDNNGYQSISNLLESMRDRIFCDARNLVYIRNGDQKHSAHVVLLCRIGTTDSTHNSYSNRLDIRIREVRDRS